jgi:hypothetical protein
MSSVAVSGCDATAGSTVMPRLLASCRAIAGRLWLWQETQRIFW